MKVNAFMNSLQARLLAEDVPYDSLAVMANMTTFQPVVSMRIGKRKWISFEIDHRDTPITYIRDIVIFTQGLAIDILAEMMVIPNEH